MKIISICESSHITRATILKTVINYLIELTSYKTDLAKKPYEELVKILKAKQIVPTIQDCSKICHKVLMKFDIDAEEVGLELDNFIKLGEEEYKKVNELTNQDDDGLVKHEVFEDDLVQDLVVPDVVSRKRSRETSSQNTEEDKDDDNEESKSPQPKRPKKN